MSPTESVPHRAVDPLACAVVAAVDASDPTIESVAAEFEGSVASPTLGGATIFAFALVVVLFAAVVLLDAVALFVTLR